MRNKSEKIRVLFITLFLVVLCLILLVIAPSKDWYIFLMIFSVPTLSILAFGLLSNRLGLSSNPKRSWIISYFGIAFISFFVSAMAFYLTNYSWRHILLYSAGFGGIVVVLSMISNFVWSKIKQSNLTRPE